MTYQELVDKTLDHIQIFHEGEICHVYDINTAERAASYVDSDLVKYSLRFQLDGAKRDWSVK